MLFLLFGKPLVFWMGILALILFIGQIYLGVAVTRGKVHFLPYHKINALILSLIVLFHLILALQLYGF